jgi:hypothetical protein
VKLCAIHAHPTAPFGAYCLALASPFGPERMEMRSCGGISLQSCRRTVSFDAVGLVPLFITFVECQS